MKIKRSRIEYAVQHQLDNWYASRSNIIWS